MLGFISCSAVVCVWSYVTAFVSCHWHRNRSKHSTPLDWRTVQRTLRLLHITIHKGRPTKRVSFLYSQTSTTARYLWCLPYTPNKAVVNIRLFAALSSILEWPTACINISRQLTIRLAAQHQCTKLLETSHFLMTRSWTVVGINRTKGHKVKIASWSNSKCCRTVIARGWNSMFVETIPILNNLKIWFA